MKIKFIVYGVILIQTMDKRSELINKYVRILAWLEIILFFGLRK